jgi:crotonobetainyl-CoA:carnitine CoA-transferase CaiB-like acyl-CoA transferase
MDLGAEVIKVEPPRPDVSRFAHQGAAHASGGHGGGGHQGGGGGHHG